MQGAQNKRPLIKKRDNPKMQGAQNKWPLTKKEATSNNKSHEGDFINQK
jgi:hypothetical protein